LQEEDLTEQYRAPKSFSVNQFAVRTGRHVSQSSNKSSRNDSNDQNVGFFVRDAPWNRAQAPSEPENTEFPSMNMTGGDQNAQKVIWGPRSSA
jgi:hypothetical protein